MRAVKNQMHLGGCCSIRLGKVVLAAPDRKNILNDNSSGGIWGLARIGERGHKWGEAWVLPLKGGFQARSKEKFWLEVKRVKTIATRIDEAFTRKVNSKKLNPYKKSS